MIKDTAVVCFKTLLRYRAGRAE